MSKMVHKPPGPFRYWCFYVKNLGGQAHNRIEESHQVNQPPGLLESILNPYASLEKKIDLLETKLDSLISMNKVQSPSSTAETLRANIWRYLATVN